MFIDIMDKYTEFVGQYTNPNTHRRVEANLNRYFTYIKQDPNIYITEKKDKEDYQKDLLQFWNHIKTQNLARTTRRTLKNTIRIYLRYNDIILPEKFWKEFTRFAEDKGTRAVTIDEIPSKEELKQILTHGNTLMRGAVLLLSSSGIRPEEMVQTTVDMYKLEKDPPRVELPGRITKNRQPRVIFCSYETRDTLKEWLKELPQYRDMINRRCKQFGTTIPKHDNRMFPLTRGHLSRMWTRLLKQSGNDERDNNTHTRYYKYHLYTLKKYFRTRLAPEIKGGADTVRALMGHEGYLDSSYERYGVKELGEWYKQAMGSISLHDSTPELKELHEEMSNDKQRIKELESELHKLNVTVDLLINKISG